MGIFRNFLKIIELEATGAGLIKMPVSSAMREFALNMIAGAAPVNYAGTQIGFPLMHSSANRRQRVEPAVAFTEN